MYYELLDYESGDSLGIVEVIGAPYIKFEEAEEEVKESWTDFNRLHEHELDNQSVDDFVSWHNENWKFQIERIFLTQITPE